MKKLTLILVYAVMFILYSPTSEAQENDKTAPVQSLIKNSASDPKSAGSDMQTLSAQERDALKAAEQKNEGIENKRGGDTLVITGGVVVLVLVIIVLLLL
jgi:hypothetical protein